MKEEARKNRTTGRLGSKGQGDSLGSAARLDYAKREIVAARFFEIPADVIEQLASSQGR